MLQLSMKLAITASENHGKVHSKIMETSMWCQLKYPFYSEILLLNNIIETRKIETAGVNFSNKGMNFYYNPDFFDTLSQKECNFVVIHEILHQLFDHSKRTGKFYQPMLANIAQDMIINDIIKESFIGLGQSTNRDVEIPVFKSGDDAGKQACVFMPIDYKGEKIFEVLYDWLKQKQDNKKNNKKSDQGDSEQEQGEGEGDGEGNGQDESQSQSNAGAGEGSESQDQNDCKPSKKGGKGGKGKPKPQSQNGKNVTEMTGDEIIDRLANEEKNGESLDKHIEDEVDSETRKEIALDAINRIKARGQSSADFEAILNKLRKSRKDHLKEIKRHVSFMKGKTKHSTWAAPNRKELELKGYKKYNVNINVILDTSGSMGGDMEHVLSYIFQDNIKINLIQIDAKVQAIENIKNKRDLLKMKIKGLGRTELQPAIDYVVEHFNKFNTVILTDGHTDSFDLSKLKHHVLILSTSKVCPISHSNGKLRQVAPVDNN
jgi:predicted metal-dependent peptidase